MKTIKIPDQLHQDLRKVQAEWNIKTIPETIRAIYLYYKEIHESWKNKNDKSKK